jgi:hypothetical protein
MRRAGVAVVFVLPLKYGAAAQKQHHRPQRDAIPYPGRTCRGRVGRPKVHNSSILTALSAKAPARTAAPVG